MIFIIQAKKRIAMNKHIFRLIFKEIAQLKQSEPKIAQHISGALRQHVEIYKKQKIRMKDKIKKQQQKQLPLTFLSFIEKANQPRSYDSYLVKTKIVEIFTGINRYVDRFGHMDKTRTSRQINVLETNPQYCKLKDEEKKWVRSVIEKVFFGEEKYPYTSLTQFFTQVAKKKIKDDYYDGKKKSPKDVLKSVPQPTKSYVQAILKGQIQVKGQWQEIYRQLFGQQKRSNCEIVFESYIQSRYFMLDFEDFQGTTYSKK